MRRLAGPHDTHRRILSQAEPGRNGTTSTKAQGLVTQLGEAADTRCTHDGLELTTYTPMLPPQLETRMTLHYVDLAVCTACACQEYDPSRSRSTQVPRQSRDADRVNLQRRSRHFCYTTTIELVSWTPHRASVMGPCGQARRDQPSRQAPGAHHEPSHVEKSIHQKIKMRSTRLRRRTPGARPQADERWQPRRTRAAGPFVVQGHKWQVRCRNEWCGRAFKPAA
jgi:hypothetical protein